MTYSPTFGHARRPRTSVSPGRGRGVSGESVRGRHGAVLAEVATLAEAHPWRERWWRQRMTCLYRAGRPPDALAIGQGLRRRLVEELGLDPTPELLELERAILDHAEHFSLPSSPAGSTTHAVVTTAGTLGGLAAGATHRRPCKGRYIRERRLSSDRR